MSAPPASQPAAQLGRDGHAHAPPPPSSIPIAILHQVAPSGPHAQPPPARRAQIPISLAAASSPRPEEK